MHRRNLLKSAGVIALYSSFPIAVSEFLASCRSGDTLKTRYFSDDEFDVLEKVVDILLPRTVTPGGVDTKTPFFIDLIVKECMAGEDQKRVKDGINELQKGNGNSFLSMTAGEQQSQINSIDQKAFKDDAGSAWFRIVKKLALIGHFTSMEGMTTALNYVKVPGDYKACIPYHKGDKAMAKTFLMYW